MYMHLNRNRSRGWFGVVNRLVGGYSGNSFEGMKLEVQRQRAGHENPAIADAAPLFFLHISSRIRHLSVLPRDEARNCGQVGCDYRMSIVEFTRGEPEREVLLGLRKDIRSCA